MSVKRIFHLLLVAWKCTISFERWQGRLARSLVNGAGSVMEENLSAVPPSEPSVILHVILKRFSA